MKGKGFSTWCCKRAGVAEFKTLQAYDVDHVLLARVVVHGLCRFSALCHPPQTAGAKANTIAVTAVCLRG